MVGGLIPLVPYMFPHNIGTTLQISVAATGVALLCFGAIKGHFSGVNKIKSALRRCWSADWSPGRRIGSRTSSVKPRLSPGRK